MPISDEKLAQIRRKQEQFRDALLEVTQLWTREIDEPGALAAGRKIGLEPTMVSEFLVYWVNMGEGGPSWLEVAAQIRAHAKSNVEPAASRTPAVDTSRDPSSYDLFISHASEDKDAIARPLYEALKAHGISVWFDEAELTLGDSLRRKIDDGLARCRYGIVILSPRFLEKEWPQRELDGLVARETVSGQKALLPVWHELTKEMLLRYSPTLADRLAADTSKGLDVLVTQIKRVLAK
jgi:TIR domain.